MQQLTPSDDMLLDRGQVELYFGLTKRWLEVQAVKGGGPAMVKLGRAVRYRTGDIRSWIENSRVNSTSDEVE